MKSKPKGAKYRHLVVRGGVIYYQREISGRRTRFSTATTDWDQAAAVRDFYEQRKGIGTAAFFSVEVPTFSEFSGRYLAEDTSHLAPTTRSDLDSYLREGGPLLGYFGGDRLDGITVPRLREWWNREVILAERSVRTGRAYLDVLSNVLGYVVELEVIEANPVPAFRQHVRRRQRTQRARSDAETRIRPIESPWDCEALLEATLPEGPEAFVYVLLGLDAGLRQGEALGLRWGAIGWADGDADPARHLLVDASRPRGGELGPTKSGRAREVAMSLRLHRAFTALYRQRWNLGPDRFVVGGIDPSNFRAREWRRILKRAGIGKRSYKDLRDTYASSLITAGVQLGYVSAQLGHADVAVTARHYAKWIGGDVYRAPLQLRDGDVPADFIARFAYEPPQSHPTKKAAGDSKLLSPRPLLRKLVELRGIEPLTLRLPA
jgi:integrase